MILVFSEYTRLLIRALYIVSSIESKIYEDVLGLRILSWWQQSFHLVQKYREY